MLLVSICDLGKDPKILCMSSFLTCVRSVRFFQALEVSNSVPVPEFNV